MEASAETEHAADHARRTGGGVRAALRKGVPRPLRAGLQWASRQLEEGGQRAFERYYGVETAEHVYLDEFGLEGRGRVFYEGAAWLPLRRAIAPLRPGPQDVFVDIGSGKGQALIVAGRFRFGRVIGVELAEDLTKVARRNLDRARPKLSVNTFELVTSDAEEWEVPDDVSVVFMYCPFVGDAFTAVIDHLLESHDRNPRPLHLVYAFPWEHNRLLASGRFEVVDIHPAQWPSKPWWPWSSWVMPTYRVLARGEVPSGRPKRPLTPLRRKALQRWSQPTDQHFSLVRPGQGAIEDF